MNGLGINSLIPKKNNNDNQQKDNQQNYFQEENSKKEKLNQNFNVQKIKRYNEYSETVNLKNKEKKQEFVFQIEVEKIKSNPYQPRKEFKEEDLKDLAQSIRNYGILQPLVVTKIEKETETGTVVEYQLISGERRLMAAKLIGLERVPVIIKNIDSKRLKLELALIENLQRSDLNPIEQAKAYARLNEEFGLTQQEIALKVGKSREAVANTMRLLKLPLEIQNALVEKKINESQARILLAIDNYEQQLKVFESLLKEKLSVRTLKEKIISKQKIIDPEVNYLQKQLEEEIKLPVRILKRGQKGKIIVYFYSEKDLEDFIKKLIDFKNDF